MPNAKMMNIANLIEKDINEAFFALETAYKAAPSYATMHNFGTFLSKYGKETSFFSENTYTLAKDLLLSAQKQRESFITLKELGDLFLDQQEYPSAVSFYTLALKHDITYSVCYNLAECYYNLNDYEHMQSHLAQVVHHSSFSNDERAALQELYGFACAFNNDNERAAALLESLKENPNYAITPDTLKLAYLCGDYRFIKQHYVSVFREWMVEAVDYQILYQAFCRVGADTTDELENWTNRTIVAFYRENPDIEPDSELLAAIHSNDCTPKITLTMPPVFSCDFYGQGETM